MNDNQQEIIEAALEHDLDPLWVSAFVSVESSYRTEAARYEDHFRWTLDIPHYARNNHISQDTEEVFQKTSWGLLQIMGSVTRELGFEGFIPNLLFPEVGLYWGCKLIKKLSDKYESMDDVIASYNAGSPRKDKQGEYMNQEYVIKVNSAYNRLKGNHHA